MPSGLYGFRPKERPQYQSTDAVTNPIDPRIPRAPGEPPIPTAPESTSPEPYHSGVSAENDDGGQAVDSGASYASPQEAFNYNKAALSQGYFGTVQDAANAGRTDILSDFLANPTTDGRVKTPGTLGFIANQTGLTPSHDFTNLDTAQSAINAGHARDLGIGVDAFGGLGRDVANTGIGFSNYTPTSVGSLATIPDQAAIGFDGTNAAQIAQEQGITNPGQSTLDAISGVGYSDTGAAAQGSQFSSTGTFSTGTAPAQEEANRARDLGSNQNNDDGGGGDPVAATESNYNDAQYSDFGGGGGGGGGGK